MYTPHTCTVHYVSSCSLLLLHTAGVGWILSLFFFPFFGEQLCYCYDFAFVAWWEWKRSCCGVVCKSAAVEKSLQQCQLMCPCVFLSGYKTTTLSVWGSSFLGAEQHCSSSGFVLGIGWYHSVPVPIWSVFHWAWRLILNWIHLYQYSQKCKRI